MRERLRVLIAAGFYYSGLVKLAHRWIRHSGRHLIILNYHRATGGDLQRQLLYLRRHYRILPLEGALEEFYCADKSAVQERQTPDRRVPPGRLRGPDALPLLAGGNQPGRGRRVQ